MSGIHQCQFLTNTRLQCRKHLRNDEYPVRYSPILRSYFCAQHEHMIIADHFSCFLEAQFTRIRSQNNTLTYTPFSRVIMRRLTNPELIQHIPQNMLWNHCLFKFDVMIRENTFILDTLSNEYSNNLMSVVFTIKNDLTLNFIQYGGRFNDDKIYCRFNKYKSEFSLTDSELQPAVDNFILQLESSTTGIILTNSNYDYVSEYIAENQTFEYFQLREQLLADLNPVLDSDISDVEELPDTSIQSHSLSSLSASNQNIPSKFDVIFIPYCNICGCDDIQKGIGMSCCNRENRVCINCIITHQILDNTKYCSITLIKDMNMFDKPQNCFFCRKSNVYSCIKYDSNCRFIFTDIVKVKYQEEMQRRLQDYMTEITYNIENQ